MHEKCAWGGKKEMSDMAGAIVFLHNDLSIVKEAFANQGIAQERLWIAGKRPGPVICMPIHFLGAPMPMPIKSFLSNSLLG